MSKELRKPYEISLWEEIPTYLLLNNGEDIENRYEMDHLPINGNYAVLNEYKKERCLAIIGSDTMETPIRAFNPKFTQNVNGTNSLSFDIFYRYYDEDTEDYELNPFTNLLVNERIVKLNYDGKWYSLIIKDIQEDSANYTFSYECKDLYINELSKTGYNIEFNTELRNNHGTIKELAETIVKDSEWTIDDESETVKQKNREGLYTYKTESAINAVCLDRFTFNPLKYPELNDLTSAADGVFEQGSSILIPADSTIFICYSSFANREKDIQFFYHPPRAGSETLSQDYDLRITDGVIINSPNWTSIVDDSFFEKDLKVSTSFFGEKLIAKQESRYISEIDKVATLYKKDNIDYYCITETTYDSVANIKNMLSNSSTFMTENGWVSVGDSSALLGQVDLGGNNVVKSLKINFGTSGQIINTGIYDNRQATNGFIKGEEYVFAIKAVGAVNGATISTADIDFFNFTTLSPKPSGLEDYQVFQATCVESLSYADLLDSDVNFYLTGTGTINLVDAKLFKKKTGVNGNIIIPDLEKDINSIVKTWYKFFESSLLDQEGYRKIFDEDSITYAAVLSSEDMAESGFTPVFSEAYEKIRNITAEKSNRFNLIQELCEIFECWAEFNIECDDRGFTFYSYEPTSDTEAQDGKHYYEKIAGTDGFEDRDYQIVLVGNPAGYFEKNSHKTILFKEFVGEDNPVGFRYGVNLQSIKRSVQSDQIVSKLIVEPNSNEFAENGSCTIQTAPLNPTGETSLYNFDYYIKHGLLDKEALYRDMYGDGIGLYPKLKKINNENQSEISEYAQIRRVINTLESRETVYKNLVAAAREQLHVAEDEILKNTNSPVIEELKDHVVNTDGRLELSLVGDTVYWTIKDLQFLFNTDEYIKVGVSNTVVARPDVSVSVKGAVFAAVPTPTDGRTASGSFSVATLAPGRYYFYGFGQTNPSGKYWPVDSASLVIVEPPSASRPNNDYVVKWEQKREEFLKVMEGYKETLYNTANLLQKYREKEAELLDLLKEKENKTSSLMKEFHTKYSRFIQEGTWTSEDYIDSELYYIDAQKVLYTSSSPQVSYTIDVVELSQLEGFEPYKFKVGDKTYIEDTEFFGWDPETDMPFQEEIVVSEVMYSLEDPSKNVISVQNYKTQFEDLFQRIAATTQSLQYAEGKYDRAAGAINADGTIKSSLLRDSLDNNALILKNAKNQSVVWDETGITISNEVNPNELVRLVSSGIMLTHDGGKKWTTGITGEGINASVITTGRLDTDLIRIFAGDSPSFEWDGINGISAYMFSPVLNNEGQIVHTDIDRSKFVRFNKYGLFGFDGDTATELNTLEEIKESSVFSLTWDGLKINVQNSTEIDEIININDGNFMVYGDGSIVANDGVFSGVLEAASGTFSGALQAATGEFKGTMSAGDINIADNFKVDEEGNVTMSGGITLNGAIEWGTPPIKYEYSATINGPWYSSPDPSRKFRRDIISGQAGQGYQYIGEDGAPGSSATLPGYITQTSINYATIISPTIEGNNVYANSFGVYYGSTQYGTMGIGHGKDGAGETYGVKLTSGNGNYLICTNGGVRMQAGIKSLFVTDSGLFYDDGSGSAAKNIGASQQAVFG